MRWDVEALTFQLRRYDIPVVFRLKGPPPPLEDPVHATHWRPSHALHFLRVSGNVYTGTVDGTLWRIGPDDRLTFITQMGQNLPECGWCSVCLWREDGSGVQLSGSRVWGILWFHSSLDHSSDADGVPFAFLNGLEVSSQTGMIYFPDLSSHWGRQHAKLEVTCLFLKQPFFRFIQETDNMKIKE